jgi:hypothetical protein
LFAEDLKASLEITADQLEFLGGKAGGQLEGSGRKAFIETADSLEGFGEGTDKDLAAVAGVAKALDEAGFFEAIQNAGDSAGGQTGSAREISGGEGRLRITGHQFEASGIGNIEAKLAGDGLVEEDGNGAEFAAEIHADFLDQGIPFARDGGLFHFILTAKYLTI